MGAAPSEANFEVIEPDAGGYETRAIGLSIFTQGEDWNELKEMAREPVLCHFDGIDTTRVIRLHQVREEAIAV